jgi:N utilization substance protein B
MPSRHRSRERALQILYLWDMRKQPVEEAIEAFYGSLATDDGEAPPARDPFSEELVSGVVLKAEEVDAQIQAHSEHWRIDRMAAVDRSILRLAIYEMSFAGTPPPIAIDEALLLAQRFSGDASVAFVNGVLDAVKRELPKVKQAKS